MLRPNETVTGISSIQTRLKKVVFGKYTVTVQLGPSDEFIGIYEVAVKQGFLRESQRRRGHRYHDVADLYEE